MKKESLRKNREQQKLACKNKWREADKNAEAQKKAEAQERAEAQEKAEASMKFEKLKTTVNVILDDTPKKHSHAKAVGLKSTFSLSDGRVLMTSFGNGNNAVIEKFIDNDTVVDCQNNIDVKPLERKDFAIKRKSEKKEIITSNPQKREKVGKDMIDRKDELEMRFFGKTFDDNIHIQLIYNILDIEKIFSIYANNTIFALDNVINRVNPCINDEDYIGVFSFKKDFTIFKNKNDSKKYDSFNEMIKKPQLSYFGQAFFNLGFDTKGQIKDSKRKDEADIYYIIGLLSMIRQSIIHSTDICLLDKSKPQIALFTLDERYDKLYSNNGFREGARKQLDDLYDSRIKALNDNFMETAQKDLTIIFSLYDITQDSEKLEMVRIYADFVIKKEYKYLGFSIKVLRELIIADNKEFSDDKYNTVRTKLNRLLDFIIYMHYKKSPEKAASLVEKLRAQPDEKAITYSGELKPLWKSIKVTAQTGLLKFMNGKKIANMIVDKRLDNLSVEELKTDNWKPLDSNAHYFIKLVYLITLFIDGKEINDLVTTLINKVENIASFNQVLKDIGDDAKYCDEYSLFEDSSEMSAELRAINSFARMAAPGASSRRIMFVEAAKMLGDTSSDEDLIKYFDQMLGKNSDKALKGFRNFISNNVIESNRFKYLIRYCDIDDIQAFAKNRQLVNFVLNDIPQAQLLRYYNSCMGENERTYEDSMQSRLTDIIANMSFNYFEEVKQDASTPEDLKTKEMKRNVIRLFLSACYLFYKNLVYVNSRYFLAFYLLERDAKLWNLPEMGFNSDKNKSGKIPYTTLTEKFLDEKRIRSKPKKIKNEAGELVDDTSGKHIPSEYIRTNCDNADDVAISCFRNKTAHLNVVQKAATHLSAIKNPKSYFQIYHYIAQHIIYDEIDSNDNINDKTKGFFELIDKYSDTYCKDFLKALCAPFGYNLPRFKNLTIDGLFDKNRKKAVTETDNDD